MTHINALVLLAILVLTACSSTAPGDCERDGGIGGTGIEHCPETDFK